MFKYVFAFALVVMVALMCAGVYWLRSTVVRAAPRPSDSTPNVQVVAEKKPTDPPPETDAVSVACSLASAETGERYSGTDSLVVRRFTSLLEQLGEKCGESYSRIRNGVIITKNALAKVGIAVSPLEVMQGLNRISICPEFSKQTSMSLDGEPVPGAAATMLLDKDDIDGAVTSANQGMSPKPCGPRTRHILALYASLRFAERSHAEAFAVIDAIAKAACKSSGDPFVAVAVRDFNVSPSVFGLPADWHPYIPHWHSEDR